MQTLGRSPPSLLTELKLDKIETLKKYKIPFVVKWDDRRCPRRATRMTALYRDDSPSNLIGNVVISMSSGDASLAKVSMRARAETASGSACVTHAWDATTVPVGRTHALQRSYLAYTSFYATAQLYSFDAINIDASRPCVGCKLGHCDARGHPILCYIYLFVSLHRFLREWGITV